MRHTENVCPSNRPQEIFNTCPDTGSSFSTRRCEALRFSVPLIPLIGPTAGDVAFRLALPGSMMDFCKPWISIDWEVSGNDLGSLDGTAQGARIGSIEMHTGEPAL